MGANEKMGVEKTFKRQEKVIVSIFFLVIFVFFVVLYTRIVPLVIFNMDDWDFISFGNKRFLPDWGSWNPSRVLPEMLMPFVAQLSVYLIYPFSHDFLGSIELGMAITISAMVTVYSYAFYQMIRKRRGHSIYLSYALTLLFLVLHFLIFRTKNESNDYLFNGYYDATTYFFYLIPALLNASLVLAFCPTGFFSSEMSLRKRALLLPAVYFAVFSNIHQSIILAVYVCFDMLNQLIVAIREKNRKKGIGIWKHIAFLALWGTSLIYENSGGRANGVRYTTNADLIAKIKKSWIMLRDRLCDINGVFLTILICTLIVAITVLCLYLHNKQKEKIKMLFRWNGIQMLLSAVIALVYVFLICSVSLNFYITRGDVLLSSLFFLFVFMIDIMAILLNKVKKIRFMLPMLLVVCLLQVPTGGQTFKSSINNNIPYETARKISREILNSYVEADIQHEDNITIEVPKFTGGNWPLTNNGPRISKVLFKYHIISRPINAELVPSADKNKEYNLPEY